MISVNKDNVKIIKNLNPSKAHGYGIISIHLLEICDDSISKPLELRSKSCVESGKFFTEWKKANVPIHKNMTNS